MLSRAKLKGLVHSLYVFHSTRSPEAALQSRGACNRSDRLDQIYSNATCAADRNRLITNVKLVWARAIAILFARA